MRWCSFPQALLLFLVYGAPYSAPYLGVASTISPRFQEELEAGRDVLLEELKSDEYVVGSFYPERAVEGIDPYSFVSPEPIDYSIAMLVDPCKNNRPDCCHRAYGTMEYPMLKTLDTSVFRVRPKYDFADVDEVLQNTFLLDDMGEPVEEDSSRLADDSTVIDDSCTDLGVLDSSCIGFRQRMVRATQLPNCLDNNQTVHGLAPCQDRWGNTSENCLAVAYTQTALSMVCENEFADHPQCGTFLEVHMAHVNNYVAVDETLSDLMLDQRNTTGFTTVTIPTTWMGDPNRVLCAYEPTGKLVGTSVLITEDAPRCCCPAAISQESLEGSFMCPVYNQQEGPFAVKPSDVEGYLLYEEELDAYPYCPYLSDDKDERVVSERSEAWGRMYTRPAATIEEVADGSGRITSTDLEGDYDEECPYFTTCALAGGACIAGDSEFSFKGVVGRITSVPDVADGWYGVTFNDGRTVYQFKNEHLIVEASFNYELWWVQRTRHNSIVQSRKPFTVTAPRCTFDTVNNRYFPYALVDDEGNAVD